MITLLDRRDLASGADPQPEEVDSRDCVRHHRARRKDTQVLGDISAPADPIAERLDEPHDDLVVLAAGRLEHRADELPDHILPQ